MESSSSSATKVENLTDAKSGELHEKESEGTSSEVSESETSSSSSQSETFESVSASDFKEFSEQVNMHLDVITASTVILLFTLFVCAGILAVDTLVRSFERGSR